MTTCLIEKESPQKAEDYARRISAKLKEISRTEYYQKVPTGKTQLGWIIADIDRVYKED